MDQNNADPVVATNETAIILGLCALAQEDTIDKPSNLINEIYISTENSPKNTLEDVHSDSSSDSSYGTMSSWDSEEDNNLSDDDLEIEQISEIKNED